LLGTRAWGRYHEAGADPKGELGLGVLRLLWRGVEVLAQGGLELIHGRDMVRDDLGQRVAWLTSTREMHRLLRPEGGVAVIAGTHVCACCPAKGLAGRGAAVRVGEGLHSVCGRRLGTRIARVHGMWGLVPDPRRGIRECRAIEEVSGAT
jgi:hypothetical protein